MSKHSRTFVGLAVVALLALAGCGGGGDDGNGDPGPQPTPTANLAPWFGCVKGVVTAGDARILVLWDAATDDNDDPSELRYRVYLSATSEGHDFTSPVATSGSGATSMQLTSADSSLIAVGQEVFVVVRAVDTDGAVNDTLAECACTPAPATNVAYVDSGAAAAGSLGDPSAPFPTVQEGLDAIPSAGGLVLVAGGTYDALTAATAAGDAGSTLGLYGSFDASGFAAGATPQSILAGFDPEANATIVDGTGLVPTDTPNQIGHLDIRNDGRRTYVGGFAFWDEDTPADEEDREFLLGGEDIDLVVCCCTFTAPRPDSEDSPYRPVGARFWASAPGEAQRIAFVGNFCDELDDALKIAGGFDDVALAGNRAEDGARLLSIADDDPLVYPGGADVRLRMDCNDVARMRSNAIRYYSTPEVENSSGSIVLRLRGNRISGAGSSTTFNGLGRHGTDGLTVLVEDNFMGPIDSDGLYLLFIEADDVSTEHVVAAEVDVDFRRNTFTMINSDAVELRYLVPGADATVDLLFENSTFVQGDQESLEWWSGWRDEGNLPAYSQDNATFTVTVRDITARAMDGLIDADIRTFRGGRSACSVTDCMLDGITDEPCEIEIHQFTTDVTSKSSDAAETAFRFEGNTVFATDESSVEVVDMDFDVLSSTATLHVRNNVTYSGEESVDLDFYVLDGDDSQLDFVVEGNEFRQADDDNILDVDFYGQGVGTVHALICNNDMRSGRDVIELDCYEEGSQTTGFVTVAHNYFTDSTEGETVDISFSYGTWSVLIARNLVVGGGDDAEEAFEIGAGSEVDGAAYLVRNNLVTSSGGGIDCDDPFRALQLVNNTVAFSGQGYDNVLGANSGGPNNPCYVHNCISFGNDHWDVGEGTIATFSLFQDPPESAGFGSILGDPVFRRWNTIIEANDWFQLASASPAVDAGDPSAMYDDPDGSRNDMGAFGGPGAGAVGTLESPSSTSPFYLVGFDPLVDLYAGANLLESGMTTVDVVFTHDVDASTATSTNLRFEAGGVAVAGTYAADGKRIRFTPTAGWTPGSVVRVIADTGLATTTGTALEFEHVRFFGVSPTAAAADTVPTEAVQKVAGDLADDTDVDAYTIEGSVGDRLQVSLFGQRLDDATAAMFGLRLIAPDGTTVVYENHTALQEGDPFIDVTLPTSGTWTVEAFDYDESKGDAGPFRYELEIFRR